MAERYVLTVVLEAYKLPTDDIIEGTPRELVRGIFDSIVGCTASADVVSLTAPTAIRARS